jgi:accessory gene regulator B
MSPLIEQVAHRIATKIKEVSPEETASVELMKFALIGILHNTIIIVTALCVGLITGKFADVLIAVASFMLLRLVSGGFHFKSPLSCFIFSTSVFIIVPFIPLASDFKYFHVLTAASFLLCAIFAPSNIKEHIRVPEKYFFVFKILSLAVVAASYFIEHPVVTLSLLVQSFTLIPMNYKKEVKTNG